MPAALRSVAAVGRLHEKGIIPTMSVIAPPRPRIVAEALDMISREVLVKRDGYDYRGSNSYALIEHRNFWAIGVGYGPGHYCSMRHLLTGSLVPPNGGWSVADSVEVVILRPNREFFIPTHGERAEWGWVSIPVLLAVVDAVGMIRDPYDEQPDPCPCPECVRERVMP